MPTVCDVTAVSAGCGTPGSPRSAASTGVITKASRRHQRRDRRKQLTELRGTTTFSTPSSAMPTADVAIQCQLISPQADLERDLCRLRKKLGEYRLKVVALKGKIANMRRLGGEPSDDDWWGCDSASSCSSDDASSPSEFSNTEDHEQPHVCDALENVQSYDVDSGSLDDTIGIGDVVMVKGLRQKRAGHSMAITERWWHTTRRRAGLALESKETPGRSRKITSKWG